MTEIEPFLVFAAVHGVLLALSLVLFTLGVRSHWPHPLVIAVAGALCVGAAFLTLYDVIAGGPAQSTLPSVGGTIAFFISAGIPLLAGTIVFLRLRLAAPFVRIGLALGAGLVLSPLALVVFLYVACMLGAGCV
jgi:hypothetical protein